jgi:hypothetical protein
MIHQPDPVSDPSQTDDANRPFSATNTEGIEGTGTRWGLLVMGAILLVLGLNGAGGYLVAIPDWVPTAIFLGFGLLLLIIALRSWMSRPKH